MIIVQLMGGLGNQLFQYATGRALAWRLRVPLKLDVRWFATVSDRSYRLDRYQIQVEPATEAEISRLTFSGDLTIRERIAARFQTYLPYYRRSVFREQSHFFDPNLFRARKNVYLVGYWQSGKYFKSISHLLRSELRVNSPPGDRNQHLLEIIDRVESVSLHIRRGDYVSNPVINQYHGVCSLTYYRAAVDEVSRTIDNPYFFIFSDDMEWAKANLKIDYPVVYVDHNGPEQDYEDLRLMSHCKHHIIANSSFSWWGAWLSTNIDKIVVAPKRWFSDPSIDTHDLIPESWIRL